MAKKKKPKNEVKAKPLAKQSGGGVKTKKNRFRRNSPSKRIWTRKEIQMMETAALALDSPLQSKEHGNEVLDAGIASARILSESRKRLLTHIATIEQEIKTTLSKIQDKCVPADKRRLVSTDNLDLDIEAVYLQAQLCLLSFPTSPIRPMAQQGIVQLSDVGQQSLAQNQLLPYPTNYHSFSSFAVDKDDGKHIEDEDSVDSMEHDVSSGEDDVEDGEDQILSISKGTLDSVEDGWD